METLDVSTDESFMGFLPGRREDDAGLIVRFYLDKLLMGKQSRDAGREIYVDREFCEIRIKGQPKQVVNELVTPEHIQKYPVAYAHFRAKKEIPVVGTPIEQLPGVGPSMIAQLKTMSVRSIEDMAKMNDAGLQSIGNGASSMQKTAKAFLDKTSERTVTLEQENAELKRQLDNMNARMAALENSKTSKRLKKQQEAAP